DLGADQNGRSALVQTRQQFVKGVASARALVIDAQHRHVGETCAQCLFQAFGAMAARMQWCAPAFGTGVGRALLTLAMMADQSLPTGMKGHRLVATFAMRMPAAGVTHQYRRVAAAVA